MTRLRPCSMGKNRQIEPPFLGQLAPSRPLSTPVLMAKAPLDRFFMPFQARRLAFHLYAILHTNC
jgi:hypothetical protein